MKKYLIRCKFCGGLLFKVDNPSTVYLDVKIKCPNHNCQKILELKDDKIIDVEEIKL